MNLQRLFLLDYRVREAVPVICRHFLITPNHVYASQWKVPSGSLSGPQCWPHIDI